MKKTVIYIISIIVIICAILLAKFYTNKDYFAEIKKDENGRYIQNNINSINIEVKITEFNEEQIYAMETLYDGGMSNFVKYYGQIKFKCSKVEYNDNKKIKYIMLEQVLN